MARSGGHQLDSGEQSNSQGKHLFRWAQVYLHQCFGVAQECASEASPLIVPASCRRAHVAERARRAQTGFFSSTTKPKGVFNLVVPIQSAGTRLALVENETI